jgi:16S rRNA (guanine1207-N2)-methyltransferase
VDARDAPFPETLVRLSLPDHVLDLTTESGLFSHRKIDTGTQILLEDAPRPPSGEELLDLGCGYGPIALALALRSPKARVWAVDVDDRALQATERNARRADITNVVTSTPRAVPDGISFSAIYSNPPTRIGKAALLSLLTYWLARLEPGACGYLAIKKDAGADSITRSLNEAGFVAKRFVARRGYRVLQVAAVSPLSRHSTSRLSPY